MKSRSGPNVPPLPPEDLELLHELLADRALFGLEVPDQAKLDELLRKAGLEEDDSFDLAAGVAMLALADPAGRPPASVYTRVAQAAEVFAREMENGRNVMGAPALRMTESEANYPRPRRISSAWLGWMAAAACLAFAAIGWIQIFASRQAPLSARVTLASLRESVSKSPDAKRFSWSDWDNPEIKGVKGEVVWSEDGQRGYMTFRGLPQNDPTKEQYQLWVVDERGLDQRVSGGIFNGTGESSGWQGEVRTERLGDELIVEIAPRIHVGPPALFAVTIEKPGGTWVSDMKRRVVVAAQQ
ncbi:MAG: anti-sigma factor [Phycisphaeraceae bacterium]|nr:anti-sigma factor [Phycisphaeraceae bacterium]